MTWIEKSTYHSPVGPIEIEVRGFHLSLRKTEAVEILIESSDSVD